MSTVAFFYWLWWAFTILHLSKLLVYRWGWLIRVMTAAYRSYGLSKASEPRNNFGWLQAGAYQQFPSLASKSDRLNILNFIKIRIVILFPDVWVIVDWDQIHKFHGTDFLFGFMLVSILEVVKLMHINNLEFRYFLILYHWTCESVPIYFWLVGQYPELLRPILSILIQFHLRKWVCLNTQDRFAARWYEWLLW